MKIFLKLAALLLSVWLAGCASTGGDKQGTYTLSTGSPSGVQANSMPPGLRIPVYPSGSLRALPSVTLNPLSVYTLTPPADMWDRIRLGFAMPDLDSDLVRDREQWYSSRPGYVQRMTDRGSKYLFYIVEELERRNMPTELALLPFIESAFNPQAVSSARAAGMWQFMPATGRHFDLTQNMFRDDRRDVLASTRAALDYMQRLYGMFGDWHLALAAYNWGEGSVGRAIAKNKKLGLGTSYTDLKMPMETQFYVPKLQAVKNIVADPARYNVGLPAVGNHPYFQTVDIRRDIDVTLAAKLAEVPLDDFRALNPSASKPVLLAAGTPQILLPWDNAQIFQANLESYGGGSTASWTAWIAPSTLKPADAAAKFGMSEADLRAVNNINGRMLIKAGSTLLVHRATSVLQDVSSHVADNGQLSLAPEIVLRRTTVKAGKKDTVASLARRYHLNAADVAQWNKISASAAFKAGQKVVVYLPARAKVSRTAQRGSSKASRVSKISSKKTAKAPVRTKAMTAKRQAAQAKRAVQVSKR
ncbi:transglycosylase SLT domain-containing protein [Rhodoferax antarcticus]|uniref:Lytic transglycosylase n=1 Tax=Rhodoferax antarcticus ANT.BR TaxID=1111071 RepID=A0A1Q8YEE1_9BURK|nr:transglycosylase SLT domain-containing protein [Rhodoferax antarcticus]APW46215.1 lytic transglycosylase [Rhodoferax antarcticus]OLP06411.1 lytic transglycosylase [Rhodoferax antarcticus ANT.BR]